MPIHSQTAPTMSSSVLTPASGLRSRWNAFAAWRMVLKLGITRLSWITCGLSILVVGATALLAHQADRAHTMAAIDAGITLDAKGYAKFVALNVSIVDRELTELREEYLNGVKLPRQATIDLNLKALNGLVLQVAVADADGQVVDSSLGQPKTAVSIADRPHFQAVKSNPLDQVFIGQPVLGRVSNKPLTLNCSKPISPTSRHWRTRVP